MIIRDEDLRGTRVGREKLYGEGASGTLAELASPSGPLARLEEIDAMLNVLCGAATGPGEVWSAAALGELTVIGEAMVPTVVGP